MVLFSHIEIHLFLGEREQFGSWNILMKARNEGRLFSRIEWPKDPEIVCLLTFLKMCAL